jgi:hypothetical protein
MPRPAAILIRISLLAMHFSASYTHEMWRRVIAWPPQKHSADGIFRWLNFYEHIGYGFRVKVLSMHAEKAEAIVNKLRVSQTFLYGQQDWQKL